jgi:hypothetical protein
MRRRWAVLVVLALLASSTLAVGQPNGKFNASNGCTCHGGSQTTVPTLTGLPAEYLPDTTYTLTVSMTVTKIRGGFNLQVSDGELSPAGPGVQASSNGFQATHTSPTFTSWDVNWTAPAEGSGTVQFQLAVLAGNGGGTSGDAKGTMSTTVAEGDLTNDAPIVSNLSVAPAFPTTSDDLVATYTFNDENGDDESGTTYAWYRNGTLVPSATEATLPSSATVKGEQWWVEVTPSDGETSGDLVRSANITVFNAAPRVVNLTASNQNPSSNNAVTLQFTVVDDDMDASVTEARWLLNGTHVPSLDGELTLPSLATRDGDAWVGQVRASDGDNASPWSSSPIITVGGENQPPVVTSVTLADGVGVTSSSEVTMTYAATDPEDDLVREVNVEWYENGSWVSDGTNANPLPAELTLRGERWHAMVRVFDGSNWSAWFTSDPINITNSAPSGTAALAHANATVTDGLAVEVNTYDHDGDEVSVLDVVWERNGVAMPEHRGATHLPSSALAKGETWSTTVTLSDGINSTALPPANVTVVNARPHLEAGVTDTVTSLAPAEVNISVSDADNDALTVVTAWYRNGFLDATLANRTVVPVDRLAPGQSWRMVATASDGEASTDPLEVTFTVNNLEPEAVITRLDLHLWLGEQLRVSSSASTDPEGGALTSHWTLNGQTTTGEQPTLLLDASGTLTLTVTDQHGGSSTTTLELTAQQGPQVSDVIATFDAQDSTARIDWSWSGEDVTFNVLRSGQIIGHTTTTSFTDAPPFEGQLAYTIQPFTDNRTYQAGAAQVQVEAWVEPVTADTGSTGGLVMFVLLMLGGVTVLLVTWRRP